MTSYDKKPRYFGTDGLREVANRGMLTPEKVLTLGRALGRLAERCNGGIALARDPRRSSPMISAAIAAGAASEGAFVRDLGVLPTPGLAALVPMLNAGIGVMVSASHNPMQDNGIKVLSSEGAKLDDSDEVWLETQMEIAAPADAPIGYAVGRIEEERAALDLYLEHLTKGFPGLDLRGTHLVLDCANGATSAAAPRLFASLGARVTAICAEPDGININENCGAVHPERLAYEVKTAGADLGLAFDGDGDRLIAVSHDGAIQDGDRMLYVCAKALAAKGRLKDKVVVGTVMTNFGFELALREMGGKLLRTPVGDRHVAAKLKEGGYSLGGEQSGHLIFGSTNRHIGDGLWSALALLDVLRGEKKPLAELAGTLATIPQVLKNIPVPGKPPLAELPRLAAGIAAAEKALSDTGRVLVRYSGTENKLRVMVEGRDGALVDRLAAELVTVAQSEIAERVGASRR